MSTGHICADVTSENGTCIHMWQAQEEAIIEITLETGSQTVLAGGIGASGVYRVTPVYGDVDEAIAELGSR